MSTPRKLFCGLELKHISPHHHYCQQHTNKYGCLLTVPIYQQLQILFFSCFHFSPVSCKLLKCKINTCMYLFCSFLNFNTGYCMLNTFSYIPRYAICFLYKYWTFLKSLYLVANKLKKKIPAAQDVSLMKNIITLYEKKV